MLKLFWSSDIPSKKSPISNSLKLWDFLYFHSSFYNIPESSVREGLVDVSVGTGIYNCILIVVRMFFLLLLLLFFFTIILFYVIKSKALSCWPTLLSTKLHLVPDLRYSNSINIANTGYSCRGAKFNTQNPHGRKFTANTLIWILKEPETHMDTQTYMQAKLPYI